MLWYFYSDQLQFLILVINFFAFFVLFLYAIYLYRVERRLKDQTEKLENDAESIVEDANHKALEIITKSQYLSDSMKKEVQKNFNGILKNLRQENRKFYEDLENKYVNSSKEFVEKMQSEGSGEIKDFTKEVLEKAKETEEKLESGIHEKYEEAQKQIAEYKEKKQEDFAREMREKVAKITKELLPQYIRPEDQERIAQQAVEKAYSDGFFDI